MTKRLLIVGFLILSVLVLRCGPTDGPGDADGASSDSAKVQATTTYTPWPTKPTSTPAPKPPLQTHTHEPPPEHPGRLAGCKAWSIFSPPGEAQYIPWCGRSYAKISTPPAPTRTLTTTSSPAPKTSCPGTPAPRSGSVRPSVLGIQDWRWVGSTVQVGQRRGTVEIWVGDQRLAVHPRAQSSGQRFILPGQWEGLSRAAVRQQQEALAARSRWVRWNAAPWMCTNW